MTLGEKLKEARKQAALSQEQLSEKLQISRSAVAKWEADKGIPDIENLKAVSQLLGVSIDYLLDNGGSVDKVIIKEAIDLSACGKGSRRAKKDKIVREKYRDAKIMSLIAQQKLSKSEKALDNLIGFLTDAPFGIPDVINRAKQADKEYYLIEQGEKQFLVYVSDEFIVSRELAHKQHGNTFEIGNIKFIKCVAHPIK